MPGEVALAVRWGERVNLHRDAQQLTFIFDSTAAPILCNGSELRVVLHSATAPKVVHVAQAGEDPLVAQVTHNTHICTYTRACARAHVHAS